MINQNYTSASEFKKGLEEEDELCTLAQALADEEMGAFNLLYAKGFIRQRYIDKAEDLIRKLKKHHLIIIHENKNENRETPQS